MGSGSFEIKILDIHWLKNLEDGRDLCPHGSVYVNIGGEVISNNEHEWTLSASGLYLLRTLFTDYTVQEYDNFLLPCCAHSFWLEKDGSRVMFPGCSSGVDWTIEHLPDRMVRHTSDNETQAIQSFTDFKSQVKEFTDKVEHFYHISKPRIPYDQYASDNYNLFWKEWHELKNRALLV